MSIETDHINFLIYRYLLESGFQHSSFTFGQESGIAHSAIATTHIPPGSLIAQMQRALNYVQAEINLTEEGLPADPKFLEDLPPLSLLESVQPSICEERRKELWQKVQRARTAEAETNDVVAKKNVEIPASQLRELAGHSTGAFMCQWNPKYNMLASCGSDNKARIYLDDPKMPPIVCLHPAEEGMGEVFSIDWSADGDHLCTGYADGYVRVWSSHDGELQQRLAGTGHPTARAKFSSNGRYIAAGDGGGNVMIWNTRTEKKLLGASFHEGSILSLTWIAEDKFVTAGTDSMICMFGVKKPYFQQRFSGHTDDVNMVDWNDSLKMLASGSDDKTVRLWTLESENVKHVIQHESPVKFLAWCRAEASSHLLVTGADDGTVRIVDGRRGVCLHALKAHASGILCAEFSPDGRWLATSDGGCRVIVWDVERQDVVKTLLSKGAVFCVSWNMDGTHLAFADGSGRVADIDMSS
ncbi:hypothetical protein PTSG_05241 [Salpingoeca rosetta]|uniref:WDR19 first beta-propeller domain-containing protein n=1 Tax=Salpingoeca rosetta (strain ATCC 50818 / BSB-021) TaxID=946362 RepID=F2UAW9_SALR5|nr:uncharacterized protein PTSG_05241 [Salpingoeca rosetta]EGD73535.1 hypothetical protein PTSG_05241 [Salpingoeca rosetta]|eukprot:XP_004993817.1 hypothetical protein PTSG_05241 [Salpingoeca rosetta]